MMSENLPDLNDEDSSGTFKALKIIRNAMVIGCLLFLGISILITGMLKKDIAALKDIGNILLALCVSIAVILFFVRRMIFKKRMEVINEETDFKNKTDQFRSAVIISFALIEGPAIFSIICYFQTANPLFIGLCLLITAQFAAIRLNPDAI